MYAGSQEAMARREMPIEENLLQMLAILMMDPPGGNSPDAIRDEKTRLLKAVKPLEPDHVVRCGGSPISRSRTRSSVRVRPLHALSCRRAGQ